MASAKYKRSPALIKAFRSDLAPTMMSALMLKHERELDLLENIRRTAVDERRKSVDERRKAVDEREKQRTAIAIEHEKQRLALRQKDIFVAATQRNLAYARGGMRHICYSDEADIAYRVVRADAAGGICSTRRDTPRQTAYELHICYLRRS